MVLPRVVFDETIFRKPRHTRETDWSLASQAGRWLSVLPQEADQVPSENSPRKRCFDVDHHYSFRAQIILVAEFDAWRAADNLDNIIIGDRCSSLSPHARHYVWSARIIAAVLIVVAKVYWEQLT